VEPAPERGTIAGLAYALLRPDGPPAGGVVVLHGAGSAGDNHLDFARRCRAAGLSAVVFDQRGHGRSGGALDGRAVEDVAAVAEVLGGGPVALRGSSMGGWLALAAAARVGADAVVAICPASGALLRERLGDQEYAFDADVPALDALIASVDERAAAAALGERLLLMHAEGDETVPVAGSRALHEAAAGSELVVAPGGDHRSLQHDPGAQERAVRFIAARCAAAVAAG
jgi:uncharacterized protein